MNVVRIVKGELFFDEFDSIDLDAKWLMVPNDASRYSLVERPGYLKIFHGNPNIITLINEPADNYILDMRNEYVPSSATIQAGLIAFKTYDESLELLEYYDETKDASFVYEYLRLERSGNVYTAYGRNSSGGGWELIGSGEFKSSGKVGMVVKGDHFIGAPDLNVDFVRVYRNHDIQVINVPVDYTVSLCETNLTVISAKKVTNPYSGVRFIFTDIPPKTMKFRIYDEGGTLVSESVDLDMVGGDVYYYGATPLVTVNGIDAYTDGETFLGYFTEDVIDFTITLTNPYPENIHDVVLNAVQYGEDIGYQFVSFSDVVGGTYSPSYTVSTILENSSVTVQGRITRDYTIIPSSIEPFKFNLAISFV